MGYSTPIIAKTIIIPIDHYVQSTHPTLDEYKNHFGIDLTSIFEFNSNSIIYNPKTLAKIFVTLSDDLTNIDSGVYSLLMGQDPDGNGIIIFGRTADSNNVRPSNFMYYEDSHLKIGRF